MTSPCVHIHLFSPLSNKIGILEFQTVWFIWFNYFLPFTVQFFKSDVLEQSIESIWLWVGFKFSNLLHPETRHLYHVYNVHLNYELPHFSFFPPSFLLPSTNILSATRIRDPYMYSTALGVGDK